MDDFYSKYAERYNSDLQLSIYDLMIRGLEPLIITPPRSILDAGCGVGIMSGMLKGRFSGATVVAFDFSTVAIDIAKERYDEIDFFVHDIYEWFDGRFDLIVCTETLEHLLEPEAAIRRLVEAASLSGCLFFTVPDGRIDQSSKHINFWSPESWRPFLTRTEPGHDVQAGLIEHPDQKQLRYNWGFLTPKASSGSPQ